LVHLTARKFLAYPVITNISQEHSEILKQHIQIMLGEAADAQKHSPITYDLSIQR
jgi:hypothetical protein